MPTKCCDCGKRADVVESETFYYCALCWLKRFKL